MPDPVLIVKASTAAAVLAALVWLLLGGRGVGSTLVGRLSEGAPAPGPRP